MRTSLEIASEIKTIAKAKKLAVGKMLEDCGLSVNALSSMQAGGYYPRLEAIVKIADYLGVSVDYLLGISTEMGIKKAPTENGERGSIDLNSLSDTRRKLVESIISPDLDEELARHWLAIIEKTKEK